VRVRYDYIIDSPPSLGLLTINSFTAADEIIIPLQAQFLAMQGLVNWLK
jgi:chromosome partitioning protein